MSMNELCPYCKTTYMEPMIFQMTAEVFQGLFKCHNCRKESFVVNLEGDR